MELTPLTALSPIDGRYRRQVEHLDDYFSEFGLMKYRVLVEVEYLQALAKRSYFQLSSEAIQHLKALSENFSVEDAKQIKGIEATTNHDVKAVEYFIKAELEKIGETAAREWVHFG